jgi:TonB family protein
VKRSFLIRILLSTYIIGAAVLLARSQEPISWTLVAGVNNEFAAYFPAGYLTGGRSGFYLIGTDGRDRAFVEREITVARYLNGSLLTMVAWDGDVKKIERIETAVDLGLVSDGPMRNIGKFTMASFRGKRKNRFVRTQYFNSGANLYRLTADTSTADDKLASAFFENARILSKDKWLVPNAPEGATSTRLPKIIEKEPERVDDAHLVPIADVDRPPLILYVERIDFSSDKRRGVGTGKLEVNVLLSSSGKVSKAEILRSEYLYLNQDALDAAKRTIFIPAEKDGKLVSVNLLIDRGFAFVR